MRAGIAGIAGMDRSPASEKKPGKLAIVGTGITAIAHLTLEAIGHIRNADIVFYNATSGITAHRIHELNPNTVDLYEYYGEDKDRSVTYVQMAELILREVRKGLSVVGVFHGHPGFFVKPSRRALAIAEMEGYETLLLPGISSTDCLFADLRIDPGVIGVQILKASNVLRDRGALITSNHVLLVQIGCAGDNSFSFRGYKRPKVDQLFENLISVYGDRHDSVYYEGAIFPGLAPVIHPRKLGDYRTQQHRDTIQAATLYLPPAGVAFDSLTTLQAFRKHEPYGGFEMAAIQQLDTHATPPGYKMRGASRAMMRVMSDVAQVPSAAIAFRRQTKDFIAGYNDLTAEEQIALLSRDAGRMRSVTPQPAMLGMQWAPEGQSIQFGSQRFVHDGAIATDPSHDLTHLLVAANGSLPWVPEGERVAVQLAEYNAIFLEHLLDHTFNSTMSAVVDDKTVFSRVVAHARWFVEEHFAPFPISAEEAYSRFCCHIHSDTIVRLAPIFFAQKRAERADPEYKHKTWVLQFCAADRPQALGKCLEFQHALLRQLMRLKSFATV